MASRRETPSPNPGAHDPDGFRDYLRGYRFRFATDRAAAQGALEVRRKVYSAKTDGDLRTPDAIDARSWLLAAEDVAHGRIIGTMRMTPRDAGPFECEQYFTLPTHVRTGTSIEITRFAIDPCHRRKAIALPVVSVGLFKLVIEFCLRTQVQWLVIAARPEQIRTYEWLGFQRTRFHAPYGILADSSHELLWLDFPTKVRFEGHPFRAFFRDVRHDEIELPAALPRPGEWLRELRPARIAAASA
jgi:hypothetical protein